jgi:hypothetical protein
MTKIAPHSRAWLSAFAAILPGLLLATTYAAGEDYPTATTYRLRYQFHPGETVRWQVVRQEAVRTSISGTTQLTESVTSSTMAWRVKDVDANGAATFEYTVEDADYWNHLSGHEPVRYNSKTDKVPPQGYTDVAQSIGKPLAIITLDPQGKLLGRQRMPVKGATASEGQFLTVPLPTAALAVGENWTLPADVDLPLPNGMNKKIKMLQRFTLQDVKTGVATISMATEVLTPIHDPAIEARIIPHEQNGTIRFDIDEGRILSQQMDVNKQVVGFRGEVSNLQQIARVTLTLTR